MALVKKLENSDIFIHHQYSLIKKSISFFLGNPKKFISGMETYEHILNPFYDSTSSHDKI